MTKGRPKLKNSIISHKDTKIYALFDNFLITLVPWCLREGNFKGSIFFQKKLKKNLKSKGYSADNRIGLRSFRPAAEGVAGLYLLSLPVSAFGERT
jgi:hypothetical protein